MNELDPLVAACLRASFVYWYLDTEQESYRRTVQKKEPFSDGWHYRGCLWQFFGSGREVSQQEVLRRLCAAQAPFFVMWDDHSRTVRPEKNDLKYLLHTPVFETDARQIPDLISRLPQDCYFFDGSWSWAAALTHEKNPQGERRCFLAEPVQTEWPV